MEIRAITTAVPKNYSFLVFTTFGGKLMFSQVFVCSLGEVGISSPMSFLRSGYLWYQVPSPGHGLAGCTHPTGMLSCY